MVVLDPNFGTIYNNENVPENALILKNYKKLKSHMYRNFHIGNILNA